MDFRKPLWMIASCPEEKTKIQTNFLLIVGIGHFT